MFDLIDKYCDELFLDEDFIRLMELKKIINDKYSKEIIAFKTNEAKYEELKSYGSYAIGLNEAKERFINSKTKLYKEEEVSEYFKLEAKIQSRLDSDINSIKEEISNKFKKNKGIYLDF